MAPSKIPRLDPAQYRWHRSPHNGEMMQRLAIGTEAWVGLRANNEIGQYDNYLNTTLQIAGNHDDMTLSSLRDALIPALVEARFKYPDIACTATWGQVEGKPHHPHIQYKPPINSDEALAWARHCISTWPATGGDGLEMRVKLARERRARSTKQPAESILIYLVADVADDKVPLQAGARVDVLTLCNHLFWDALSNLDIVGQLLTRVGQIFQQRQDHHGISHIKWGEEVSSLAVPILDSCKINVEDLGDDYNRGTAELTNNWLRCGSNWGLPVAKKQGDPRVERLGFSKKETLKIVSAVKKRLGPKYTLSHLGHAATVLAILKNRPVPADIGPEDATLLMPLPVNGRRYLRESAAVHRMGSCQTGATVDFKELVSWAPKSDATEDIIAALQKLAAHVKTSYEYWLKNDFQLIASLAKDNYLSNLLAKQEMSLSNFSAPIFIADGRFDHYLPAEVSSPDSKPLFTVEKLVATAVTYGSDIAVRMHGWNGKTTLIISYNDGPFERNRAVGFLTDMAGFMLQFAEET